MRAEPANTYERPLQRRGSGRKYAKAFQRILNSRLLERLMDMVGSGWQRCAGGGG